ncbi:hypothetical protein [Rummeliibacillus pycnus]|uniref:hypothetical protein n=1 Tax=Rummeliibacillus pycnus TaxID=101070 RepID=UPI003D2CCBC2
MFKNKIIVILFLFLLSAVLLGCSQEDQSNYTESSTFKHGNLTLNGVPGKIGFLRENGEPIEPDFPANQGRLYTIYILDDSKDLLDKNLKMTATKKDTGETIEIGEFTNWGINPVKLGFGQEGLWKINVTIDQKPYVSFEIKVEKVK